MVKRDNEKINELQVRVLFLSGIVEAQRLELSKLKNNREIVYSHYIPDNMLKRLRILCHPDRNNHSKMATIASQWLNDQ